MAKMMNRLIEIKFFFFGLDRAPQVISSPWFIGLIAAVIVLIIVVAIVCGIMKRKGGKYSGK
jgi:ABC-type lipoprotein release transport system permease subunit